MARKCKCGYPSGWAIIAAIITALGVSMVIVSMRSSNAAISRTKICILATNKFMPSGLPGDPDGLVVGAIEFDVNNEHADWDFHYLNTTAIEGIHILGPFPAGNPLDPPLHIALCGMPSTIACSNSANRAKGGITELFNGGSIGLKLKEYIHQKERYSLIIRTQDMPDGAVADFLNKKC